MIEKLNVSFQNLNTPWGCNNKRKIADPLFLLLISSYLLYGMREEQTQTIENEQDLVHKAKQGDERAFTALVKKYESTVYNFAYKVCRDEEKAEETLQDTFVNVYRKLNQFNEKAKFSTWLYQIVTNNCLMKRRKSKLEQSSISLDSAEPSQSERSPESAIHPIHSIPLMGNTPQDDLVNKELREHLDNAILMLPVDQRIAFILRDVEGRSSEEAAKILKTSVPALKSRLRRARVFLQKQLKEYMKV
jgi:RNA polymerase sigma-70 factor, ECF subfamily